MWRFLDSWASAGRQVRQIRPELEMLESRWVPAVHLTEVELGLAGTDIRIVGDNAANRIVITDNPASNAMHISIDANNDGDFNDAALGELDQDFFSVTALHLNLKGGNDHVKFSLLSDYDLDHRDLVMRLGGGNDSFSLDCQNHDLVNGSSLKVAVYGGLGQDVGDMHFDAVEASVLEIFGNLGAAADGSIVTFGSTGGNIDHGASVKVNWNLGGGANQAVFNLGDVGYTNQASVDLSVRGGNDPLHGDLVGINLTGDVGNGALASSLTIDVDLQRGSDEAEVRLFDNSFDVFGSSQCKIALHGGRGDDTLTVRTEHSAGGGGIQLKANGLLDILLDGGAGNDNLNNWLTLDTDVELDGLVRARLFGRAGKDLLSVDHNFNASSSPGASDDLAIDAGAGDDQVYLFVHDQSGGQVHYGPGNAIAVDGGMGVDFLKIGGTPPTANLNFESIS